MTKRKTKSAHTCSCCGVFCHSKFCRQCKFAGCDVSKPGDRCRLTMGSQLSHSLPPVGPERKLTGLEIPR